MGGQEQPGNLSPKFRIVAKGLMNVVGKPTPCPLLAEFSLGRVRRTLSHLQDVGLWHHPYAVGP